MYSILAFITAGVVTALERILPLLIFRKPVKNRFIRSFLYYIPYVTLSVMTFPAIVNESGSPLAGALSLAVGIVLAFFNAGLFPVAIVCCVIVYVTNLLV